MQNRKKINLCLKLMGLSGFIEQHECAMRDEFGEAVYSEVDVVNAKKEYEFSILSGNNGSMSFRGLKVIIDGDSAFAHYTSNCSIETILDDDYNSCSYSDSREDVIGNFLFDGDIVVYELGRKRQTHEYDDHGGIGFNDISPVRSLSDIDSKDKEVKVFDINSNITEKTKILIRQDN